MLPSSSGWPRLEEWKLFAERISVVLFRFSQRIAGYHPQSGPPKIWFRWLILLKDPSSNLILKIDYRNCVFSLHMSIPPGKFYGSIFNRSLQLLSNSFLTIIQPSMLCNLRNWKSVVNYSKNLLLKQVKTFSIQILATFPYNRRYITIGSVAETESLNNLSHGVILRFWSVLIDS